ncbi:MAG TPA: zf-HC2 domain-containing protein [Candidatus Polarisedimenticolia bacterium]|nr:zf-HC2 domain-containing protein [Candidatus Polarisedimenticolia bacterium]
MWECDEIRELLSLAVAGGLDAESEHRVALHTNECAACAAELENWQLLAGRLRRIPTPRPSAGIVERARARAELAFAEEAERRRNRSVLILATGMAWATILVSWPIVQILTRWLQVLWFPTRVPEAWHVFGGITAASWFAGVVAAVALAWHGRRERRLA